MLSPFVYFSSTPTYRETHDSSSNQLILLIPASSSFQHRHKCALSALTSETVLHYHHQLKHLIFHCDFHSSQFTFSQNRSHLNSFQLGLRGVWRRWTLTQESPCRRILFASERQRTIRNSQKIQGRPRHLSSRYSLKGWGVSPLSSECS